MSPFFLSSSPLYHRSKTQDDRDNCSKERVLDRVFDLDTELGMESCKLGLVKAKEVGKISEETRIFWKFLQNFDGRHERESNQMDQVAQSLPLPLTADFVPRMMPFIHQTVLNGMIHQTQLNSQVLKCCF